MTILTRRHRTRGEYLRAEVREFLGFFFALVGFAFGLLILAGIARSLGFLV